MSAKIIQLPPHLVAQIAAGEVIEKPLFAIKELIENSIDAHAKKITIEIEDGGLRKIIVSDDGDGMNKENLLQSFKLHTTSKINLSHNLTGIKSLGFRGEALSSIASISNMEIASKDKSSSSGTKIILSGSKLLDMTPIGMSTGTTIQVNDIFSHVPARKKFLQKIPTEVRLITDLIINFSLAYPQIRFIFISNKKTILDLPSQKNNLNRLPLLLGENNLPNLIPLEFSNTFFKLTGFISKPQFTTTSIHKQFIYVNNRKISDKQISSIIKQSFENIIETSQNPIYILFITAPFEVVDVNIHPRKEQVNFINKQDLLDFIYQSLKHTLKTSDLTYRHINKKTKITNSFAGKFLKENIKTWTLKENLEILKDSDIQQINNLYLLAQTKKGFVLIDQHAAHERILYQQFLNHFEQKKLQKNSIETTILLDLSLSDANFLKENKQFFIDLGFTIEDFSANSFKVTTIPEIFKDRNITDYITQSLDLLREGKTKNLDQSSQNLIKFLACKGAIKAGEKLTKKEALNLINKLEQTENNSNCPHGRPTKIEFTLPEINKLFKRN